MIKPVERAYSRPAVPGQQENRGTGSGSGSLLDLLLILLDRKWLILIGSAASGLLSIGVVLWMTSYYTSTAVVLPSQQKMGLPFGSLMRDMPMGGLMKSP